MEGQHQMLRIESEKIQGKRDLQEAKQVKIINSAASSSPSHEFSFTVVSLLHPAASKPPDSSPPPLDLSPADEIFFHGHLLPLHLLSNLPVSPRSSTNSLDSFTLPIKELLHHPTTTENVTSSSTTSSEEYDHHFHHVTEEEEKGRGKSRSFSLFGIPKWIKKHKHDEQKLGGDHSKISKFELLKRFIKPFLSLRNNKRGNADEFLRQQPYSYSGNLLLKPNNKELKGRREFSAPVSMRTSPTNSGLLVAAAPTGSDSTMEELQAAIQAAIAHCKNTISTQDK